MEVIEGSPTEQYAALSYVWDEGIHAAGSWLKVVLDAALVTCQLCLRYLWVDRFCIDQEDAQAKHFLISHMASIYQNAEFAIIAAAGLNAEHGLPGVGLTQRKPQPKVRVCEIVLASPLENCRENSYQEGVLARKKIVFTENQVYWECGSMVTWEAIHLPLDLLHTKNKLRMAEFVAVGVLSGKPGGLFYGHHFRESKKDDLVGISRSSLLTLEFDDLLYLPRPYTTEYRDLVMETPNQPWVALVGEQKHPLHLCLSVCETAALVDRSTHGRLIKECLRLVLIAVAGNMWVGKTARFLVVRSTTPREEAHGLGNMDYCERIGVAWVIFPQALGPGSEVDYVVRELGLQRMKWDWMALC